MKLIIADLDGTLVNKTYVTRKTLKTLKTLKEKGYLFTIATGRHMVATKELVKTLNVDLPVICGNGAIIYDFKKDEIIKKELIDSNTVEYIVDLCIEKQIDFLMYTTKDVTGTKQAKDKIHAEIGYFDTHVVKKEDLKKYIRIGVFKILAIDKNPKKLIELKEALSQQKEIAMVQSKPIFLDINFKHTNKGKSIQYLSKYLNVDIKDVFAIGDQENDITMIKSAHLGVAMGNAHEKLKEVADQITLSYEEDGFTYAINRWILNEK